MSHGLAVLSLALALSALAIPSDVRAQGRGGGRGRSEAVTSRLGNYFVPVSLPAADDAAGKEDRLGASSLVEEASAAGHPSLLYLHDGDEKRPPFEAALFGNDTLSIGLKCFRCGRVDVTGDEAAVKEFGKHLPLFVAFDEKGKRVGQVELKDYKASTNSLTQLMEKAAKRGNKLNFDAFVKAYRGFLNDLQVLEGRKRDLVAKQERAADAPDKLKKLEKDAAELAADESKLMEAETKVLADAAIPPRDPKAERLGGRQGGGRGGDR